MRPALTSRQIQTQNAASQALDYEQTPSDYAEDTRLWKDPNALEGSTRKNPWHENLDRIMFYL
jgi:hypothetical protein